MTQTLRKRFPIEFAQIQKRHETYQKREDERCLLSAGTGCVQLSASVSKKRYTPRRKESFVGLVFPGNFNPSPNTSKPGSMRCKSTVLHLVDILPVLKGGLSFPGLNAGACRVFRQRCG